MQDNESVYVALIAKKIENYNHCTPLTIQTINNKQIIMTFRIPKDIPTNSGTVNDVDIQDLPSTIYNAQNLSEVKTIIMIIKDKSNNVISTIDFQKMQETEINQLWLNFRQTITLTNFDVEYIIGQKN